MSRFVVVLSFAMLASACASSQKATPMEGAGLAALNRTLAAFPTLEVQLTDGRMMAAGTVIVGVERTQIIVASTGAEFEVPTESVVRMVQYRSSGTRTGLLVGATPGAALFVGGAIHALTTDGYGTLTGIGVMGVGLAAGALGAGIGAFIGHRARPARRTVVYEGPVERYLKGGAG